MLGADSSGTGLLIRVILGVDFWDLWYDASILGVSYRDILLPGFGILYVLAIGMVLDLFLLGV